MSTDQITKAAQLFPTLSHWKSFLELTTQINAIREHWFVDATTSIRRHFAKNLDSRWACEPFGAVSRDTRWFLADYGPESLSVSFAFLYRLDLRIWNKQKCNARIVTESLRTSAYGDVLLAFDRVDKQGEWDSELIEIGNFTFGACSTGRLSESELAWFASHETDSFVDQAIQKIERFTNSERVTEAIRRLNEMAFVGHNSPGQE